MTGEHWGRRRPRDSLVGDWMRNHQRRAKVTSEMVAEVLELNESAVRLGECRFLSQLRGEVPRNVGGESIVPTMPRGKQMHHPWPDGRVSV
mmetsp:Transcript_20616/g.44542  ORF Transcript_20616/g.44542 Transcript_20616/m.44542 type:complete len:91 (+) Transcript_20616:107-379(+)